MPVPQRWGFGCRVWVGWRQGRRQRRFEGRGRRLNPMLILKLSSGLGPSLSYGHLALRRERLRPREGPAALPAGLRLDWIAGWLLFPSALCATWIRRYTH